MFEFFIALFGGLYYGIKYDNDKRKSELASQETDRTVNNHLDKIASWKQLVVDRRLEFETREFVNVSFKRDIKVILKELGWNEDFGFFTDTEKENVVRILMASKGKLTLRDAESGIPSAWRGVPETYEQVLRNKESYDFIQFIDSLLRRNGIHEKMYIHRYHDVYNPLSGKSSRIGGNYVWAPMLCYNPHIVEVLY